MIKCPYCTTKFLTEHGLKTHIDAYHVRHIVDDNERISTGIPTILPDINFNFGSNDDTGSNDFSGGGGDFGGGGASGSFGDD